MNQAYLDTVRLLLDIAPSVFESTCFAMKGGTAINLFVQDVPRLSVDIDVVFLDHAMVRADALKTIAAEPLAAKTRIEALGYAAEIRPNRRGDEAKMVVTHDAVVVKVEVNFVFRGSILPVARRSMTLATQEFFGQDVTLPLLDTPELYGSKLVAAMDRQHPRDIFDVQHMFDMFGGLPSAFVDCFVAYLAGHNRPIHEVLFARPQPLQQLQRTFEAEFEGMTRKDVALDALITTRDRLFQTLPQALTPSHRQFLLSLAQGEPIWDLLSYPNLRELPAIRWKLHNLEKLKAKNRKQFAIQHDELATRFEARGFPFVPK